MDMNLTTTKQILQFLAVCLFVFWASFAIGLGIKNGTFTGNGIATDIDQHFGQIVRDRHQAEIQGQPTQQYP